MAAADYPSFPPEIPEDLRAGRKRAIDKLRDIASTLREAGDPKAAEAVLEAVAFVARPRGEFKFG